MPEPTISAEAVEAAVRKVLTDAWGRKIDDDGMPHDLYGKPMRAERSHARKTVEVALHAAYPALKRQLLDELREGLLGDEALKAAERELPAPRAGQVLPDMGLCMKAAFATLDQGGER